MPAKAERVVVHSSSALTSSRSRGGASAPGYLGAAYRELTAPENASVVRAIAFFGVAVAFLTSSWREFLLPPI
ncbi:MAG: hypothetical protein M1826_004473 [Phylliscum demangeonii]|nr:MAG: hypothetical protein M1826_004473 [Phylliscum demangeonii]